MKCKWIVTRWVFLCIFWGAAQEGFSLAQSAGPDGCNAAAVQDLGYTGQDVNIGLISARHALYTHEAFREKDQDGNPTGLPHVHWYDPTGQDLYEPDWHDTSMAGILASRGGKNYPDYLGMAPGAEVYSSKITRPLSETDPTRVISDWAWFQNSLDHFRDNQCRVVVTGVQFDVEYDTDFFPLTLLYDYYAYAYDMIFANAAGNITDDNTVITIFGTAYNGITTSGLVTTESDVYRRIGFRPNHGPTTDGRMKPDISGPAKDLWVPSINSEFYWQNEGYTGETSWSAPHTAGVAALLLSYADSTLEPDDGRSEVIKAVMVNAAFPNILDKSGNSTTGQVWNEDRGYGRIDALRALEILNQPKIDPGISIDPGLTAGWAFQSLSPGQTHTYLLSGVPIHDRLIVTVTWKRKVEWKDKRPWNGIIETGELTGTLADLDLQVYNPNGQLLFPSLSAIDNLEKADLLLTTAGEYQISIVNKPASESAADYALAFERLEPILADFNIDYIVNTDDLSLLTNFWLGDPCPAAGPACGRIDLIPNGTITLDDFAEFGYLWLTQDDKYYPYP